MSGVCLHQQTVEPESNSSLFIESCCILAVYLQFVDDVASSPKLSTGSLRVARRADSGQLGVGCGRALMLMLRSL